ncbi:hypothetical protein HYV64_00305 [Candidatus Shapirobacteria bacterium]|nr:hypothetical protein [Candidatus Shapirobacteria bacterium]
MKIETLTAWQLSDSPACNSEAEEIMGELIRISADAQEWKPVPVTELDRLFTGVTTRDNLEAPLREGVINLRTSGLVTLEDVDGVRSIVVTEKFKTFYEKASQKKLP